MKKLLIVLTLLVPGWTLCHADLPCTLGKSDYKALAHAAGGSPLAKSDLDKLSPAEQSELCKARKFMAKVKQAKKRGASLNDIGKSELSRADVPKEAIRYVGDAEWEDYRRATISILAYGVGR